ncbi:beta-mannosidase [Spinactinospora alkalitolerans]|uniref:beta-mannosidase n=1 Tax=Spinactinospora alkalitolerans TaxID=687207 RepID=A0A852TNX1_9ACTN|nr:glycoside hydrolase family 2 protein [Spinactinospora alkalitolerans]NYE46056.1 beta-mannosidase [Spinactinospora alkalitolerans]
MAVHFDLRENWTVRAVPPAGPPEEAAEAVTAPEGVPAAVPGCVHTDLLAAGLIGDPYADDNETRLGWIGRTDWRYATVLAEDALTGLLEGAERLDLVCDGLDTVAEVRLNDRVVGRTANMHRSYRFDVTDAVRAGDNELAVTFTSAYRYAEDLRLRLGDRPGAYPEPFQFIRKMACNFGWDWGPTLVTAGIWRPIGLHAWSTARLAGVRPEITVRTGADGRTEGVARLHVELERTGAGADAPLTLTAAVAGQRREVAVAPGESAAVVEVRVPDPRLWWPRGHGDQPLYDLGLRLDGPGGELDAWRRRVGFRTVELDTRPDAAGTPFTIRVNGEPILVKGANWIPDDCFPARVTRERYAERIDQVVGANMNLLRIWGGGRYESDDLYELCGERGVLVWQDFLFACAAYPEEPPLAEEVEAEAREAVVRLAHHAALVLWNGNNENIWGHEDWGWKAELGARTWGERYYLDLLPRIVAELDPTRPYWPGSPYSGRPDRHPNDPAHGTVHIWDVWNERDYTGYLDYRPRFVAEFGFQAPPAHATLRAAVGDEPLAPDSPGVRHHQKAEDGDGKLARGLAPHFGPAAGFDDWHYLTQVNQARAISLGIEHFRAQWPLCAGTVVWQLNDCWPVTSWSAVDGAGRRKPLWYALRRVHRDRLVTVRADGGLSVVLCNDTGRTWEGRVRLARRDLAGAVLEEVEAGFQVGPRGLLRLAVPEPVARAEDPARELVTADVTADGDVDRAWWFFAEDVDLALPEPEYDAEALVRGGDLRVTVTARTLLRDLALFPDRLDGAAEVDEALVTLLPEESHTFTIEGGAALDPEAVLRPPVLRCVNEAVRTAPDPAR